MGANVADKQPKKPIDLHLGRKYPSAPRKVRVMTAVIGMVCTDGIVLAADQQISLPGEAKHHEHKIDGQEGFDWTVAFAYSGSTDLMKEATEKIIKKLTTDTAYVDPESVRTVAESTLEAMSYKYTEMNLHLLIATASPSTPALLKFNGSSKALCTVTGIELLGSGDSALLRYLSHALYKEGETDLSFGIPSALYMIDQAKSYVEGCGGPTDLLIIEAGNKLSTWPSLRQFSALAKMHSGERESLKQIIQRGVMEKPIDPSLPL